MNQIKILYDAFRMITKKSTIKKLEKFMVLFSYIVLVVLHWFHHFVKGILKNKKLQIELQYFRVNYLDDYSI